MGQAFDREGNVLGEASGATKREVFDALTKEHPNAHEIRIKSLETGAQTPMPRYACHKKVWALKIAKVERDPSSNLSPGIITPAEEGYAPFAVDVEYMLKHQPEVGGYYVVYEDGYKSFSPAQAFEEGYTRL